MTWSSSEGVGGTPSGELAAIGARSASCGGGADVATCQEDESGACEKGSGGDEGGGGDAGGVGGGGPIPDKPTGGDSRACDWGIGGSCGQMVGS
eukprot:scaffold25055_cov106-Isochrysis_galbana.AAC.5